MFVERRRYFGSAWQIVVTLLVALHESAIDKVHFLVQHTGVAKRADIAARRVREPQVIVRDSRPHATAVWRVPPVLDIALAELVGCAAEELLAKNAWLGVDERHRILQLIAEAER